MHDGDHGAHDDIYSPNCSSIFALMLYIFLYGAESGSGAEDIHRVFSEHATRFPGGRRTSSSSLSHKPPLCPVVMLGPPDEPADRDVLSLPQPADEFDIPKGCRHLPLAA